MTTWNCIQKILDTTELAVLATECAGQPHTSLIAITPQDGCRQLIFATYRNTRKYRNLVQNCRVSILVDGRGPRSPDVPEGFVVTAVGQVQEISGASQASVLQVHLHRHPDLASFLQSSDCVLLGVAIETYQVVRGIDDVSWWRVDDLAPGQASVGQPAPSP